MPRFSPRTWGVLLVVTVGLLTTTAAFASWVCGTAAAMMWLGTRTHPNVYEIGKHKKTYKNMKTKKTIKSIA